MYEIDSSRLFWPYGLLRCHTINDSCYLVTSFQWKPMRWNSSEDVGYRGIHFKLPAKCTRIQLIVFLGAKAWSGTVKCIYRTYTRNSLQSELQAWKDSLAQIQDGDSGVGGKTGFIMFYLFPSKACELGTCYPYPYRGGGRGRDKTNLSNSTFFCLEPLG